MGRKSAFLADVHLGYRAGHRKDSNGVNLRESDGYHTFETIVDDMIAHEVKEVVIGGDVFHSAHPSARSVVEAQEQFRRLARAGIAIYALAGNHDVTDVREEIAASKILDDKERHIYSHVEPYVKYEIFDDVWLHMISHHMYHEQSETMRQVKPVDGAINILTTHGSTMDPILEMVLQTKDSPREIVIPDHIINMDWDYTMLGHIHERQWVGSKDAMGDSNGRKIYYNGSIIRRGFSDAETPLGRGWTLFEIDSDGQFRLEPQQVAQRPQVDFPVIDAVGMSSTEITDKIVSALKDTQVQGLEFDPATAPILRQKIINLTPSQHNGMDKRAIDENSVHALTWDYNKTWLDVVNAMSSKEAKNEGPQSTDMVQNFRSWSKNSATLSSLSDNSMREKVEEMSQKFVRMGQDIVLEKES